MYQVNHTIVEIGATDYIRNYRDADKFITYCQQCNRYGTCWVCPPFGFDLDEYISVYEMAYIIGSKITWDKDDIVQYRTPEQCKEFSYHVIKEVRRLLDGRLLELEKEHPGSKAFFAGTCHRCAPENCTRKSGKSCIDPDEIRPSLEAVGFDIEKTSSELLHIDLTWSKDGMLPEYLTLVSGLFTHHRLLDKICIN